MPMNLNTNVHVISKGGLKESIKVRDIIARGEGHTFESLKMLDGFENLCSEYNAELAAAELDDREEYLPLGAHLLPQDYQDFLYTWNKAIALMYGDWVRSGRDAYKREYPFMYKIFMEENKNFKKIYSAQVEQVKAYQAEHKDDDSVDEPVDLPPVQEVEVEPEAQPQPELQPEPEAQPEAEPKPKVKPLVSYNDSDWPSPIPKVFVQLIRGNNAWQYRYGKAWEPFEFRCSWKQAGNTEFKLTHDNCIRYLAYRMGVSTIEQFLEMTREQVRSKLIFGRLPNSLYR